MTKLNLRRSLHEVNADNDMKYSGPLSYRHLRIFGWFCLIVAQFAALITIAQQLTDRFDYISETTIMILTAVGTLAIPLFLLANFALIFDSQESYKRLLIKFGGFSAGVVVAFIFLFEHYVKGTLAVMVSDENTMTELWHDMMELVVENGSLECNLFIDIFLCVLFMYFLNATPKRVFVGKKLIIFRLFALLPVLYEAASLALKTMIAYKVFFPPLYLYPFLSTKPPMVLVMFIVLALILKFRERKYLAHGKTHEDYAAFLKTNANSFHFSAITAIALTVASVIDLIVLIITTNLTSGDSGSVFRTAETVFDAWGIGQSFLLVFLAPIMLLFSYNRTYKNKLVDFAIPLCGIGVMVFIYIEALFYFIRLLVSSLMK